MDLAIARNIRLGGSRQVQFRVDMFNAFNAVVINGRHAISVEQPDGSDTIRTSSSSPTARSTQRD